MEPGSLSTAPLLTRCLGGSSMAFGVSVSRSSLWMNTIPLYSFASGQTCACLSLWGHRNNVAMNVDIQVSTWAFFLFFWVDNWEWSLAKWWINFLTNCQIPSQAGCAILFSYQQYLRFPPPPHPHWPLVLSVLFNYCHSNRHKMISHFPFYLYFPNEYWC